MAFRGNYEQTAYDSLTSTSTGKFLATMKSIAHDVARQWHCACQLSILKP